MALHRQKTFALAARTGNALLARVKANQPRPHEAVAALCARTAPVDEDLTIDRKRRGRHEHRRVEVFAPAELPPGGLAGRHRRRRPDHPLDLAPRHRLRPVAAARGGRVLCLPGPARLDAPTFGRLVRGRWGIENRSHHVRDRLLREDDSRIRTKPGIFARPRSFALNLLRANGVSNASETIYANALSLDRLLAYGLPKSQN